MRSVLGALLFIFTSTILYAQGSGVHFEQGLSWEQVQAKAKAEHKYIFMDCYTTWCGPCKFMSQHVFPLPEVGDFFNRQFVSVAVQMDKTPKDAPAVQAWYKDAGDIEKQYIVEAYPTYLIFSPDGQAVHRVTGSTRDGKELITKVSDAFDPARQYYTVIGHYRDHAGDSAFLRQALEMAFKQADGASIEAIGNMYFDCLKDLFSKGNLLLICRTIKSSKDKGFRLFIDSVARVDTVLGEKTRTAFVNSVIVKEDIDPFVNAGAAGPKWKSLSARLEKKYPGERTDDLIALQKVKYYLGKKDQAKFDEALLDYMKQVDGQFGPEDLNQVAWLAFSKSENRKVLAAALKWSRSSLGNKADPNYFYYADTYANLLYKTGDKKNAIDWESRAIAVAGASKRPDKEKELTGTKNKMENGEKTW